MSTEPKFKTRKTKVNVNPIADKYANWPDERIIEYSSPAGGGLISFTLTDGGLVVDLYRHDATVDIRVGKADGGTDGRDVRVRKARA